jgi:hypothetical protein
MVVKRPVLIALAFAMLATGCLDQAIGWGYTEIVGSGQKSSAARTVPLFTRIQVEGAVDVEARVGEPQSLTIEGDDNLLENVTTDVRDGKLVIGTKKSYSTRIGLRVRLVAPKLEGIGIAGSGDALLEGVRSETFSASVAGSGDVEVRGTAGNVEIDINGSGNVSMGDLSARKVEVSIHGSGDVRLRGTSDELGIAIHGSGDVVAADLRTRASKVRIFGSGDVQVNVTESLDAQTNGSGDVVYAGNPAKVDAVANGSGDIVRK